METEDTVWRFVSVKIRQGLKGSFYFLHLSDSSSTSLNFIQGIQVTVLPLFYASSVYHFCIKCYELKIYLTGGNKRVSAAERWRRKKAGQDNSKEGNQQQVTELTELANRLLTKTGNMDIYQESYEHIASLVGIRRFYLVLEEFIISKHLRSWHFLNMFTTVSL